MRVGLVGSEMCRRDRRERERVNWATSGALKYAIAAETASIVRQDDDQTGAPTSFWTVSSVQLYPVQPVPTCSLFRACTGRSRAQAVQCSFCPYSQFLHVVYSGPVQVGLGHRPCKGGRLLSDPLFVFAELIGTPEGLSFSVISLLSSLLRVDC